MTVTQKVKIPTAEQIAMVELRRREDDQRFDCTNPSSGKLCDVAGLPLAEWCDGCVVRAGIALFTAVTGKDEK